MLRNKENGLRFGATIAILIVSPLALGAKGCNRAVVGDDGPCKTASCAAGEDGMTGGSAGTATGGASGKGGTATGGTSGSKATGGSTATGGGPASGGASGSTATGGGPATGGASGSTATGGGPTTGGASGSTATGGTGGTATGGSSGEPGLGCGARSGDTCADTEFCSFAPGALCGRADATGTCETKPEACDDLYMAVCGCDGMTYPNDCFANMAGISVDTVGECDAQGGTCGGLRGAMCADGTFCDFPPDASCGAADQTGTCQPTPSGCTKELSPVCGCDDTTYDNECMAHAAGVSVAAKGECGTTPDFCGGIAGFTCPDGQYCNFPASAMCGAGDMTGSCAARPEACTQQYDPVCGCDGKTYGNACSAASAGISVQASGACPTK